MSWWQRVRQGIARIGRDRPALLISGGALMVAVWVLTSASLPLPWSPGVQVWLERYDRQSGAVWVAVRSRATGTAELYVDGALADRFPVASASPATYALRREQHRLTLPDGPRTVRVEAIVYRSQGGVLPARPLTLTRARLEAAGTSGRWGLPDWAGGAAGVALLAAGAGIWLLERVRSSPPALRRAAGRRPDWRRMRTLLRRASGAARGGRPRAAEFLEELTGLDPLTPWGARLAADLQSILSLRLREPAGGATAGVRSTALVAATASPHQLSLLAAAEVAGALSALHGTDGQTARAMRRQLVHHLIAYSAGRAAVLQTLAGRVYVDGLAASDEPARDAALYYLAALALLRANVNGSDAPRYLTFARQLLARYQTLSLALVGANEQAPPPGEPARLAAYLHWWPDVARREQIRAVWAQLMLWLAGACPEAVDALAADIARLRELQPLQRQALLHALAGATGRPRPVRRR
jgi:hypothetical protein